MNNYEYEKNNCTRVSIKLCNNTDADIIELLNRVKNKQGYIKTLIRGDMMEPRPLNKYEHFSS